MFSSEQPTSQTAGHTIYTPSKSSTSKLLSGETWDISYGDGSSASGNVYTDNVSVGKATVTAQAVECAETVSAEFVSDTSDGLLGLAFDSINTVTPNQQKTFFFNAIAQGLPLPVFTANLKKGAPGNYNFGYIDSTEYTGSITYVPVSTANGFWEFTGNGYAVGSGAFVSSSIDAIADTGTTLLYLPAAAVKAYYAKVSGAKNSAAAGGYIFPCSATLPSITLGIGAYKAVVPGTYINYAPYSGSCKSSPAPLTALRGMLTALRSVLRWHPVQRRHRVLHLRRHLPQVAVRRLQRQRARDRLRRQAHLSGWLGRARFALGGFACASASFPSFDS